MAVSISTRSGGQINLIPSRSSMRGDQLYIHIDQTSNIKSGEDEATIGIDIEETKRLILMLNEYIAYTEGRNYVAIIDYNNNNGRGISPLDDDGAISPSDIKLG